MLKCDLNSTICKFVDNFLNRNTVTEFKDGVYRKNGIIMPIRIRGENNQERTKTITHQFVLLFFGNTSVYYKECDAYDIFTDKSPWINTSNHFSCWRHDGLHFLSDIYFDMCKKLEPDLAPRDVDIEASIGSMSHVIKNVIVEYEYNDDGFINIINIEKEKN